MTTYHIRKHIFDFLTASATKGVPQGYHSFGASTFGSAVAWGVFLDDADLDDREPSEKGWEGPFESHSEALAALADIADLSDEDVELVLQVRRLQEQACGS